MAARHTHYCTESAALGEGFPNLVGGVVGLAVGLVRGSVVAARRLAEDAVWMDDRGCAPRGCGCVHRYVVYDRGPCGGCSCCG